MSDIKVPGFKASDLIDGLAKSFEGYSPEQKKAEIKKTNGIFQLEVSNDKKETATWTIDLKKEGAVYKGPAKSKADVTIVLSDQVLTDLVEGKTTGQKAFMTGKLKAKGNVMLATKLANVLKGPGGKL